MIVYKEFEDKDCVYMDKLTENFNYIKVNSLPTNKFIIKWSSFDEYMKALKNLIDNLLVRVLGKLIAKI